MSICDGTKMMQYKHEPIRVWHKVLTTLERGNFVPPVNFGRFSVMIWRRCISSKGVRFYRKLYGCETIFEHFKGTFVEQSCEIWIYNKYLATFKFLQENDPKYKEVSMWFLYNCGKVMDTSQSLDLSAIIFWTYLNKRGTKRQPKNMTALKTAILYTKQL